MSEEEGVATRELYARLHLSPDASDVSIPTMGAGWPLYAQCTSLHEDDSWILTASGDQTVKLWDVEAKAGLGIMRCHTGSVKSLCAHPLQSGKFVYSLRTCNHELFVSGSRDDIIALWDIRCVSCSSDEANEEHFLPIGSITDAHVANNGRRTPRKKVASKSITAVLYLKDERVIASAGAAERSEWLQEGRVHGIASLAQDSTGTSIIASCMDNKIYLYNAFQPDKGPLKCFSGRSLGSFYIKSCFSPDGTQILSGSTDGNAFIWQADKPQANPVKLSGDQGEVTAVDWCPSDFCKIATASDDYTVRVWNIENSNFESEHSTPTAIRRRVSAYPAAVSQRLFGSSYIGHLEDPLPNASACELEFVPKNSNKGNSPQYLRNNEALTPQSKFSVSRSLIMEGLSLSPSTNIHASVVSPNGKENGSINERTPETKSPSSVLNPPSSSKRKTILDYFGTN